MYILAIETSCDDTAVALYHREKGLISHTVDTQMAMLSTYGGVVPELASREHLVHLLPMIEQLLMGHCRIDELSAIAYTRGPGLVGALLSGYAIAKGLSIACNIPIIGINHLEAHIQSIFLQASHPEYPFITLLVSGGHTLLIQATQFGSYTILGRTVDDAAGEAFDKIAKLLGLGFPGGANLSRSALSGDRERWMFTRPMMGAKYGLNMSFSGLKTAARLAWEACDDQSASLADFCASYEAAIVDILVKKTMMALTQTSISKLVLAGGVAANHYLRTQMINASNQNNVELYLPDAEFCTDNAAMVAVTANTRLRRGESDLDDLVPTPIWSIEDLS